MSGASAESVASCVDRMYRAGAAHRPGAIVRTLPRGWARVRPGVEDQPTASTAFNRVHWYTLESPLNGDDVEATDAALRASDVASAFFWCSEAAVSGDGVREVGRVATEVTDVRYHALARALTPPLPAPSSFFEVRRVPADELGPVFELVECWYGSGMAPVAASMARSGLAEYFAAFEGEQAVALSGLLFDRAEGTPHGYLGWTGTSPDHRGRGAQSAMIAARLARAAEVGADWCVSETSTANGTSLRNLQRLGFQITATWRVFRWARGGA